jgi:hypothetical protein
VPTGAPLVGPPGTGARPDGVGVDWADCTGAGGADDGPVGRAGGPEAGLTGDPDATGRDGFDGPKAPAGLTGIGGATDGWLVGVPGERGRWGGAVRSCDGTARSREGPGRSWGGVGPGGRTARSLPGEPGDPGSRPVFAAAVGTPAGGWGMRGAADGWGLGGPIGGWGTWGAAGDVPEPGSVAAGCG